MDDGRVSVGASGVEVGASVVLLDELVLEVDTVLEVLAEDEFVESEDEDTSLEVAEEDVLVAEALKTRQFSICSEGRFRSCRTHRVGSKCRRRRTGGE